MKASKLQVAFITSIETKALIEVGFDNIFADGWMDVWTDGGLMDKLHRMPKVM